ncbi:21737_t:CDS:2 [Gigaspora rosea]|nr:21737_t:CDS:2 [Gigaspora rosea]
MADNTDVNDLDHGETISNKVVENNKEIGTLSKSEDMDKDAKEILELKSDYVEGETFIGSKLEKVAKDESDTKK